MASKKPKMGGRLKPKQAPKAVLPKRGEVKRYVLTSIQNNTRVWPGFNNIVALAEHYGAELLVGTFTYQKANHGVKSVKRGSMKAGDMAEDSWYDPEVEQYIRDDNVNLAHGLMWCGKMNILPTASNPLGKMATYKERHSLIVPHAKQSMRSVVSGKNEGTKLTYTTGTIGQHNYIQKLAGILAEEHHCYGGLIVEVRSDGSWYVRQLQADDDDVIYDLNLRVQAGIVTEAAPDDTFVEAINWGDIHEISLERPIRELCWGKGGIIDQLRPRYQFMHDLLDFRCRNHHDVKSWRKQYDKHAKGMEDVRKEVHGAWKFLTGESWREFCETVVVPSNHDEALNRWIDEADFKKDPINAEFYLERALAYVRARNRKDDQFLDLEDAMVGMGRPNARFLRRDEDFVICKDNGHAGVECGLHGDTMANLANYGRPLNIGHRHAAGIYDHLWVAGIMAAFEQGYNIGPSSWTHSLIITYRNGKRAIVTIWKGAYRA